MGSPPGSQADEMTDSEYDKEAVDYVECPVCGDGAMTNVIQCDDCSM